MALTAYLHKLIFLSLFHPKSTFGHHSLHCFFNRHAVREWIVIMRRMTDNLARMYIVGTISSKCQHIWALTLTLKPSILLIDVDLTEILATSIKRTTQSKWSRTRLDTERIRSCVVITVMLEPTASHTLWTILLIASGSELLELIFQRNRTKFTIKPGFRFTTITSNLSTISIITRNLLHPQMFTRFSLNIISIKLKRFIILSFLSSPFTSQNHQHRIM